MPWSIDAINKVENLKLKLETEPVSATDQISSDITTAGSVPRDVPKDATPLAEICAMSKDTVMAYPMRQHSLPRFLGVGIWEQQFPPAPWLDFIAAVAGLQPGGGNHAAAF